MTSALRTLALLVLVVGLVACGDDDEQVDSGEATTVPGGASLAAEYVSVDVSDAGEPHALVAGTSITLRFDGDQLGASLGCNQLGGRYQLDGDRLVVEELSTTEMGCDPERHAQDEWFAGLVQSVPALVVEGDTLTLTAGETVVRFVDREVAEPEASLVGTTWQVDGFADGQDPDATAMAINVREPGRVRFEENGYVTGRDGCNEFGYATSEGDILGLGYEVDGGRLVLTGGSTSTLVGCPDVAEYVERFWGALTGTVVWSIDGDVLVLMGEDGRVMSLRAAS